MAPTGGVTIIWRSAVPQEWATFSQTLTSKFLIGLIYLHSCTTVRCRMVKAEFSKQAWGQRGCKHQLLTWNSRTGLYRTPCFRWQWEQNTDEANCSPNTLAWRSIRSLWHILNTNRKLKIFIKSTDPREAFKSLLCTNKHISFWLQDKDKEFQLQKLKRWNFFTYAG